MHYSFDVSVTPEDDVDSPVVQAVKLGSGILRKVKIYFPAGCNGCVRCSISNDSKQLLPTNLDGYYAITNDSIEASLWYDLAINSNLLYAIVWSSSANYEHTLTFTFDVKEDNEPDPWMTQKELIELMNRMVGIVKNII